MTQLFFTDMPAAWVLWLVIAPAVIAFAAFAYRLRGRNRSTRRATTIFRVLLLALVIFLCLGPALRDDHVSTEPAPLALLLDDSASMSSVDGNDGLTRQQNLSALLGSPFREQLDDQYDLMAWQFAERLVATNPDGSQLNAAGQESAPGDALLALMAEYRGRRMLDVVLFSDGRSTSGVDLPEVSERLRNEGVKVHVVSYGNASAAPDLMLERIQTPDLVLAGDVALFSLRLRATGSNLPSEATVRLLDESGNVIGDSVLVQSPDENGVNLVLSAVLQEAGERTLTAEVIPVDGETAIDNNRITMSLTVKEVQVRVLYVEGGPRWEYRYLKDRLIRAERDISLSCWLAEADRNFTQEHSRDADSLLALPVEVDDLLENFDLVILGDADPTRLTPDPIDGQRFLASLAEFVEKGGGLLMLAGPKYNPSAYIGTPIEAMLPIIIGREDAVASKEYSPLPPDIQRPHPVVLFSSDPEQNRELWTTSAPLWWYSPVERLRPGAQAWLVNNAVENRFGPHVIAASIFAPEGWVGWIGTDETWRWRFPGGEKYVDRFWRSALRHLAITRLRGDHGRLRLDLDRTEVELGAFLQVEARLLDDSFQPVVSEEVVPLFLDDSGNTSMLSPVPDQPGIYRGRIRASSLGPARVFMTEDGDVDSEVIASARFNVHLSSREMANVSQDQVALAALASRTGGQLVPMDRANDLLDTLDGKNRVTRVISSAIRDLEAWPFLALFLVLAAAEWLLRKRMNLS